MVKLVVLGSSIIIAALMWAIVVGAALLKTPDEIALEDRLQTEFIEKWEADRS